VSKASTTRVAVAVALSLTAVTVVVTRSASSPVIATADAGAWLVNTAVGTASHVNGLSAESDGEVTLPGTSGHRLDIGRGGPAPIVVDKTSGALGEIDPARQSFTWSALLSKNEIVVSRGAAVYAVAPGDSAVDRLDPRTLRPSAGPAVASVAPPRRVAGMALADDGTLWLADDTAGTVIPIGARGAGRAAKVAPAGDTLSLIAPASGGQIAVLDSTRGVLVGVSAAGALGKLPFPSSSSSARLLLGSAADPSAVPVVRTGVGCALFVADLATHAVTAVDLTAAGACANLGAPVAAQGRVYVPDDAHGRLIVYDLAAGRFQAAIAVADGPADLELFSLGGRLWANDPAGPDAVVVDGGGVPHRIHKYGPAAHSGTSDAGAATRPSGSPAAPTSRPGTRRSNITPTSRATARLLSLFPSVSFPGPPHSTPASAPSSSSGTSPTGTPSGGGATPSPSLGPLSVTAQSGPEYVDLSITPPSGIPAVTGYSVAVVPAGVTTTTQTGPNSFRVSTPICTNFAYTFTVAAHLADGRTLTAPPVSAFGCVPPGPIQNLTAVTGNGYIQLTWAPPQDPGTLPSEVLYVLVWLDDNNASGGSSGSAQTNLGQKSYQIAAPMGAHVVYVVEAVNGSGGGPVSAPDETTAWDLAECATADSTCNYNHANAEPLEATPGGAPIGTSLPAVPDNTFGAPVRVLCQTTGPQVTLPTASWAQSAVWDEVSYGGATGYVSDLMISTTNSMLLTTTPQFSSC
jgi:hypothetical protein